MISFNSLPARSHPPTPTRLPLIHLHPSADIPTVTTRSPCSARRSKDPWDRLDFHQRVCLRCLVHPPAPWSRPFWFLTTHLSLSSRARNRTLPEIGNWVSSGDHEDFDRYDLFEDSAEQSNSWESAEGDCRDSQGDLDVIDADPDASKENLGAVRRNDSPEPLNTDPQDPGLGTNDPRDLPNAPQPVHCDLPPAAGDHPQPSGWPVLSREDAAGFPSVLVGDMNAQLDPHGNPLTAAGFRDAWLEAGHPAEGPGSWTFSSWRPHSRIDYVFLRGQGVRAVAAEGGFGWRLRVGVFFQSTCCYSFMGYGSGGGAGSDRMLRDRPPE